MLDTDLKLLREGHNRNRGLEENVRGYFSTPCLVFFECGDRLKRKATGFQKLWRGVQMGF